MEFVSFKRSFKTLIEDKGITAEEKIYHLQQYVTGAARNAIEGCFYCTTQEDYDKAWNTLENRYSHPFKIQEAYREKLEKWPRIRSKDCVALQKCPEEEFNAEVSGRGARGRPRFGWMDGVKRAIRDRGMNVREAREHARDRNEWRAIVTQF